MALALTGKDPIASIRGRYRTKGEARRLMAENGCATLSDVAARAFASIPPAMAQTGDWAVVKNPNGIETLGVIAGIYVVAPAMTGLDRIPRDKATSAFRVI